MEYRKGQVEFSEKRCSKKDKNPTENVFEKGTLRIRELNPTKQTMRQLLVQQAAQYT